MRPFHLVVLAAGPLLVAAGTLRCSNVSGDSGSGSGSNPCGTNLVGDAGDDDDDDDGGDAGSPCAPVDSDGINGGCYSFDVSVSDTAFKPIILKAQNLGYVTVNLANTGTKPHDFVMDCLAVSYPGCPPQSCFPAAANIALLAPGKSATATFVTPNPEGIYTFRSDVSGDSVVEGDGGITGLWGQFVVQ